MKGKIILEQFDRIAQQHSQVWESNCIRLSQKFLHVQNVELKREIKSISENIGRDGPFSEDLLDSSEKNEEVAEDRKELAKFLFSNGVSPRVDHRRKKKFIRKYDSFNKWQKIEIESYKLPLKPCADNHYPCNLI